MSVRAGRALLLVALLVPLAAAQALVAPLSAALPADGILLQGVVVTMDDDGTVLGDGRVLVRGDRIVAVWDGPTPPAGVALGAPLVAPLGPDALIFPGLVNLHGHPAYNVAPPWLAPSTHAQPDEGRETGEEPYANRYQWNDPGPAEYRRLVSNPRGVALALGLRAELVKWAEAMSILGGQTTFQGDGVRDPATDHTLVRNVDYGAFCRSGETCDDRIDSRVSPIGEMDVLAGWAIRADLALGAKDAYLVHLAEGVRDADRPAGDETSSRLEFFELAARGLLVQETAVIHGVALEQDDFLAMRAAPSARLGEQSRGASLVWSPLSNLVLYGRTAHVHEAMRAGVLVSLGTDWTPGGSRNLLGEMKIADIALRDPRILGGERFLLPWQTPTPEDERALDETIVRMATRNPAIAIRADDRIGSVGPGKLADLLVIRQPPSSPTGGMPASPYRSLIDATERDVRLVLVGGAPVAGDVDVMTSLKPADLELVASERGGFTKAIDITDPGAPNGAQTLAEVEAALSEALGAMGPNATGSFAILKARLNGGANATESDETFARHLKLRFGEVDGRPNLEAVRLNPLLVDDDALQFALLAAVVDEDGILALQDAPYALYRANANHVQPEGNPFEPSSFATRWYP